MIIMTKICKISFKKIKLSKSKLASALKIKKKQKKIKKEMKMTSMSKGSQLKRLIHFFQSFDISLIT